LGWSQGPERRYDDIGYHGAMDISLAGMLLAIGFGSYFQTVTGFGLGMIALGAASGLGLMPIAPAAVVVSLLTLCNSPLVLSGNFRHVDWRAVGSVLLAMTPTTLAGVVALDYLSRSGVVLLQFLLGAVIAASCAAMAIRPARRQTVSGVSGFLAAGGVAGLLGGMFGFSGPPLIFHLYRQPLELTVVRSTLIMLFTCSAVIRLVFVGLQGGFAVEVWELFAWSVPVVVFATLAGRRHPPPLRPAKIRRIAFFVVALIGAGLMASALAGLGTA
jgi:uncharacterized membrane protein YfcA